MPVKTALRESSWLERGGNPQAITKTEPLSSIKNLFNEPWVLYIHLWTLLIIFWICSRPSWVWVCFKSIDKFKNIIVNNLLSLLHTSCSISKYMAMAAGTNFFNSLYLVLISFDENFCLIKKASALILTLSVFFAFISL